MAEDSGALVATMFSYTNKTLLGASRGGAVVPLARLRAVPRVRTKSKSVAARSAFAHRIIVSTRPSPSRVVVSSGNWAEDRDQAPSTDTTSRVCPRDPNASALYATSSSAIGAGGQIPRGPRRRAPLVAVENFDAETRLNRTGARDSKFGKASVGGFGATLPTHRPEHFATYRETTYARHFVEDPRAARAKPPPPEQSDDARFVGGYPACVNAARPDARLHSSSRAFFNKGQMRKDFTDPTVTVDFRGKSGARGLSTRTPVEAGASENDCTWADLYASSRR
jgi:hypothetical protein